MNFYRLTSVVLFLFIISLSSTLAGDTEFENTIDSLKELIANEEVDTLRFLLYRELLDEIAKVDRAGTIVIAKDYIGLARKIGTDPRIATAAHYLSSQYLYLGNTDSAFVYALEAREHLKEIDNSSLILDNLNNLALLYQRDNRYEDAVDAYQKIIVYSDSLGDYVGEIYASINLMSLYMDLKDEEKALEYYKIADNILPKVPAKDTVAISEIESVYAVLYMNAGLCHEELNQLDSSLYYFDRAEKALEKISNEYAQAYWQGYVLGNKSSIFYKMALDTTSQNEENVNVLHARALTSATRANEIFTNLQEDRGRSFTLVNMGKTQNFLGHYTLAEKNLLEAISISKSIGFRETIRDAYEHLSKNAELQNDFKKSNDYLHKWIVYRDSINNEERSKFTRGQEVKFETAKKQKEITQLALENEIRTREQTIQRYIYFTSILLLLGVAYMIFARLRFKKQKEIADFEKSVNQAMSRFVPMAFIKAIGRDKITDVQLGDQIEKEVTVLFTDIRSFTTISEGMTPVENFAFVKEYAERMGPIIERNDGFVSQYLGDGIMAIFQNNPTDALVACIEMQDDIKSYNKLLNERGQDSIKVGMGMHTGSLIMGIIGDEVRRDATLISDTVNTAARIESTTKLLKADILLSEDSVSRIDKMEHISLKPMGEISVKGKNIPIQVYKWEDNRTEINLN